MRFVENEMIELEPKINNDICKEVVTFANSMGGTLYIGVDDNGNVVGVDETDKLVLQLNNMTRDSINRMLQCLLIMNVFRLKKRESWK